MKNLQLGESINTFDPAVALRGEYGTFEVITPDGGHLRLTCLPGHSIASVQWAEYRERRPFVVTKISEPVAGTGTQENTVANPAA
jgi:hypothetical protein